MDATEKEAWMVQTETVKKKEAKLYTRFNFTPALVEEMVATQRLTPPRRDNVELMFTLAGEELLLCGEEGLECYCFNLVQSDGSFLKMRLQRNSLGEYFLVAPWQELIDAEVLKPNTTMAVYCYRSEEGKMVFLFRREDIHNGI